MKKIVSLFLYVFSLIIIQLPVFLIDGEYYILYKGYIHIKEYGIGGMPAEEVLMWSGGMTALTIGVIIVFLYQIVSTLYILSVLLQKNWYLNIVALVLSLFNLFLCSDTIYAVTDNMTLGIIFLLAPMVLNALELLLTKMIDVWEEAVETANASARKEKTRKEEEKERLYFPGKYPEQFYHMIWKNFKYDWKDYSLLLLCSTVIASLSFAGIGCYQMVSELHRAENFLIGQGLGLILWNAMIPMGVCAFFLIVFVLIFYLRKWMESYSIFMTLGIRRKTMYTILTSELLLCFLFSLLCGIVLGNVLVVFLRKVLYQALGSQIALAAVTGKAYLLMGAVMIVLYVVSLMASRDILQDFNLIHAANRRIQREKIPEKGSLVMIGAGAVLVTVSVVLYAQLTRHESIYLLAMCFVGVFFVVRYGGAAYLRKEKRKKTYLNHLMNRNQLYHKSRTTAWYLTALIILYIYAMFYCSFQLISSAIAEKPESLFPYDFVCIADNGDDEFFDNLQEKYGVEIITYPMVRVSNVDKTERMEGRGQKIPQGQQIGISETTFHQLKKNVDKDYREKSLQLDENGGKVYLMHQQDRSIKAQPIDWTYGAKQPFLHIGLPCEIYVPESPSKAFTQREIAGEEIGSLIGCFRQGNLENIVVFSDEYFAKAQDMWKYTNISTGDPIENEEERIEGVTIYQGPTRLALLRADEKYLDDLEQEMETFKKHHTYEAKIDGEVSCCYSKRTAVSDMETERIMKQIVNVFVIIVMLMAAMFLIYVKSASELEEKKERNVFLKCMGMRRTERIRVLKGELYLFYRLPVLVTAAITVCFTVATFHARMYSQAVALNYLKNVAWLWGGWILIQGVFIWILGQWYVRKVEGKDE